MKQFVTLPEPAGGVWAEGPHSGVDLVVDPGIYEVAEGDGGPDRFGTGWVAIVIDDAAMLGETGVVRVRESALA